MSSIPKFWKRLETQYPSDDASYCQHIRDNALDILAGAKLPKIIQAHRESCFTCIRHLSESLLKLKAELPKNSQNGFIEISQLSFAAGTAEGLRSISESNLSKAGFSSGWHINIQNKDDNELKLCLISDLPKEVKITLFDLENQELIKLHLSQLPTYLNKSISNLTVKVLIEELN